jgi:hypothetical protein
MLFVRQADGWGSAWVLCIFFVSVASLGITMNDDEGHHTFSLMRPSTAALLSFYCVALLEIKDCFYFALSKLYIHQSCRRSALHTRSALLRCGLRIYFPHPWSHVPIERNCLNCVTDHLSFTVQYSELAFLFERLETG